jgi:hypothetical protein
MLKKRRWWRWRHYKYDIYQSSLKYPTHKQMKTLTIIVFFLILTTACVNNNEQIANSPKSILHGAWVKTDYIEEIKNTKSPYLSKEKLWGTTAFVIDSMQIMGDSLSVSASLNNHEGDSFVIYFKGNKVLNSFKINKLDNEIPSNFYELNYDISQKDTTLSILHYDKNQKLLDKTLYTKIKLNDAQKEATDGIQTMINRSLFVGEYQITDTGGKNLAIKLTEDGKILGLNNFKSYEIMSDFVVEMENNLDQICFDMNTEKQKCYAFKINPTTIELFETIENKEMTSLKIGKLKYSFVKK